MDTFDSPCIDKKKNVPVTGTRDKKCRIEKMIGIIFRGIRSKDGWLMRKKWLTFVDIYSGIDDLK